MNILVPSLRYLPLAAVLLVAAIGKAWWLPAEDRIVLFQHPLLLNSLIVTEVMLAAALLWLAPLFPGWARWLGTLLFASFAVYSASAWLRGEPCQCFGLAAVSPLVPLTFDVAAIAWLWFPIQSNPIQSNPIQFNSIQFNSIQFNSIQFNSQVVGWIYGDQHGRVARNLLAVVEF